MTDQDAMHETAIHQWKIKRLVKTLDNARGNGTSMITLIIPPGDDINRHGQMLVNEASTASRIKSRVNRLSVCSAIASTQQRLKLYNRTPPNGLVIYCGEIITEEGKEKKVTIDFEPFRPINTSLYLCDNCFHTEDLQQLLENDDKFGFVIMDGHGSLYGTLCGNTREVLHKFSVDLPKKHGRGGQSALRFARLRLEKRHNYVRKVAEIAVQMFISNDRPNVQGLVLAGSAEFKNDLLASDLFDPRLADVVIKVVDVSYGGENGFNQAIELAGETLRNVKFLQEKKLICKFMEEIAQDTGKICFGVTETVEALNMGAVETLIVWENLDLLRYTLRNPTTDITSVVYKTPKQAESKDFLKEGQQELDVIEKIAFSEWIVNNFKSFGCVLEFVTDKSQEGNQFVKGFGGIGGLMRYRIDFNEIAGADADDFNDGASDSDDEWI
ncbi:unnamed protein product [Amoebophrya sp. A120]|nr:unnamed protein product [Amoebophrya sp. A120]|eukprot:GSA120T00022658001.1